MSYTCIDCGKNYEFTQFEVNMLSRIAPTFNGVKYEIPASPYCPACRTRVRTSHRNEQCMYRNVSAKSGQSIISLYAPGTDLKLYSHDEWWAEDWDAMTYGRDFDFDSPKGFFEQYGELLKDVPRVALIQVANDNCPYTTGTGYCKNCHMISCSEHCEDCYYGKLLQTCRDVTDSSYCYDSELLYQCFDVRKCYHCAYVYYSQNSNDCYFSENLSGCRNCFLSTNLHGKEYYFMNQPLPKEEYKQKVAQYLGSSEGIAEAKKMFDKLRSLRVHKYVNVINCENSTGDFLINDKNCTNCYDVNDSEDCMNVTVGVNVKDLLDCSNMYIKCELCYEVLGTIGVYNCLFSLFVFHSQNLIYSQFCYNSKNLFGCVGLRNKQYCIFNKQYTQEEYEKLVPRLIEHMKKIGEYGFYFPMWLSPFSYNETVAFEYEPLGREEALGKGYKWKDADARENKPQTYVVPNRIADVPATILSELLICDTCGKNYKIIEQEFKFLKNMNMPVPSRCPECRHFDRMSLRNNRTLWDRNCDKCSAPIKSTYAANQEEIIYCENCYQGEVY
ncbi:hypothetical protein KBD59_03965 [Candidatus Gracilibacteria bacterium]|nr:hypothetical protein [Candidatus Gracilibacteria bacterium]